MGYSATLKTVREILLEQQLQEANDRVRELERLVPPFLLKPGGEEIFNPQHDDVNMHKVASWKVSPGPYVDTLHCRGYAKAPDGVVNYSYWLSERSLHSAYDAASVLAAEHERVVRALAKVTER